MVGGRYGYGTKLANIFSSEFTVETRSAASGKMYKQTWRDNMSSKDKAQVKALPATASSKADFKRITFRPDLSRFGMSEFDDDTVALFTRRVYDMAGVNNGLKVFLNDSRLPIKNFQQYCEMYLKSAERPDMPLPRLYERISDRWEVFVSLSEGQFRQVCCPPSP